MNNMTRVLIVEDQLSDFELAQREILKSIPNCLFERVEKEAEFVQALKNFRPDVILSDFKLPQFDGMKVLELVQQQPFSTPVIIWTGAMSEDVAVECIKHGASDYVLKENNKRLAPAVSHALKEREEILERQQAQEKFQAIFENSPIGIFQSTAQGRYTQVNASMARIYGYASAQEMIESISDIASQIYADPKERNQFVQLLQTSASIENFERRNVRKDGSIIWTSTSARAVRDQAGAILYYEGFLQDITDRKLTESKLLESEARYRGIFDNVQDAIFVESPEGDILEVNQRACDMFGYTHQEFLQKKIIDIVPSKEHLIYVPEVNLFPGQTVETINVRANGEHFPVEISGRLYEFGDRSLFLVILRDITERKETEQQLRKQEQRFRALIENGMDNISLLAKDGTLLWENPAVNSTLGYEYNEFVNHNIFELMHPDDMAWTSELFTKVIRESKSQQHGTFRLRHHDGTWRWVEATATNMLHEPSVNAVVVNYRDITERKNAEDELKKSQIQYRNLVETSNDLIWSVDSEGRFTFINHAAKAIYGYEPEELIGRFYFDAMDDEHTHLTPETFKEAIANIKQYQSNEVHVRHRDGRQFILSVNSIVLRDEQGNVTGVTGTSRDITTRKQMEDALREERNLLRTLIDNLPDVIYAMDKQGRKTLSNSADWKASGKKSMEEVVGKTDFDLYPPELAESFWQMDRMVLDSGQPLINVEEPGLDPEGNRVSILTTKIPLRDEEGNVIGLVGVGRDITERKQTEARIKDLLSFNEKILKHSPLGILTYKLNGECVFANQNAASIIGTTVENLLSQNFHSIETWKQSGLYDLVKKAIAMKTVVTDDIHVTSTFRKEIWMTVHCVTFTSNNEEHVLISILDITKRKHAEEKLILSQQELTEAQRVAKMGSWSFDPLKDEVHWSDELYRIFGVEREKFAHTYDAFLELIHPEDRLRVKIKNDSALEQEKSFEIEYRIITPEGVKTINEIGYAITSDGEQVKGLFGTAQDITHRKRTEVERQALFEIMQGLAVTNDLAEFLKLIHSTIAKVIYAENFFVVLHHPDTGLFEEIYCVDQYDPPAPPSRLEKSITSYVFRSGEPLLLKEDGFDELVSQDEVELVGAPSASWLGVPLKTSNGTIGVIVVQDYQDANRYSDHDKDFLASIATQVALAVERKQADIELQQKNDDLGLISAINEVIVRGQNLDTAVELLSNELRRIFSAVGSTIFMLSPDKQWITMEQHSFSPAIAHQIEKLLGFKIPKVEFLMKEGGHFHRVIASRQSVITTEPQEIQNWLAEFVETKFLPPIIRGTIRKLIPRLYKLLNIKSTIAVPLISGQEVIGVLDVSGSNLFTTNDLKRIENIAEQLTAVLQRQQVNEKIRKSEEFLQGVQDSLSAHIAILDQRGTVIRVNAAWCEFGEQNGLQSPEYGIGLNYLDICDSVTGSEAEVASQIATSIREVLSGKQKEVSVEYPCHSPQEKRWFTVHITCFDDEEQKWVILAHENITTRMIAEVALKESTAQLRSLFEATPDAIVLIDPHDDWPIVDCNSAACKMNGYTREELIGKSVDILNTENSSLEDHAEYFKRIQNTDILRYETTHVHKDGTIFPIEVSTSLIRLGERDLVLGIDRDITERRGAEEAIKEQQRQLMTLISNLPGASYRCRNDVHYTMEFMSEGILQLTGYSAEEFLSQRLQYGNLIHPEDRERVWQDIQTALQQSLPFELIYRIITADGSQKYVWEKGRGVRWKANHADVLEGFITDITERKRAESAEREQRILAEALRDTSEMLSRSLDYAEVLDHILAAVGRVVPHDAATIMSIEDGFARVVRSQGYEKRTSNEEIMGVRLSLAETVNLRTILETKQPLVVYDTYSYPSWKRMEATDWLRSNVGAPIIIYGKVIGFILLDSETVGFFTPIHAERLEAFANQAAVAIHNADLLQQAQNEITERKRAEEELRASEERFRQLADNIPEVFWMTDAQTGRELYASPASEKVWGHSVEHLLREPNVFINSVFPDDLSLVLQSLEKEKNGENVEMEYRITHPDGSIHWIWDRAFPIFDENDRVKTLAGIAADITERKQAEESLRESEARFSSAFEFAPIGIALVALDGKWIKVNQALCELLGYTAREMMSQTFQQITHPDDLDADLNYVNQTLRGERVSYQMEKRYIHRLGNIVWALLSVSLVRDSEGKPQYFVSQIQDISERKQAEEEIDRRAKETYALLETSLALTNLDLKAILQTVGNSAKSLFAADGCRVFLMQPDDETLRCVLAIQENAVAFSDLKVKLGEGVTGAVAASGKAEIVNEMQKDPRAVQVPGTEEEEESIMFAPLKERDRTIGVLSIRRVGARRPFQTADLELLEAFASMAASAVSNARLFEEAQQRLDELEAIYENGLAVGQLLEPAEIGNRIIETFARYLSWHHVTIRLLRPDTDELDVIAFNLPGLNEDQKIEMEHHFNQMVSKAGQGLSGWVVETATPLRTGNVHVHPRYVGTQAGIQSGLYMPLKIGDHVIGVISVESEAPDAFTEQDERLLATLASQAAVAFENARLYQTAHQELLERTRAQAALWASETHYRELADSITDILFELDYNLTYTHWNKASEMFSGIPAEEAIGKPMQDIWGASADQLKREEIYRGVLKERQARTFETTVFPRGQKRVLEIHAYPSTRGVSVVARDITERKLDETLTQKRVELMEYSVHHSLEELMQRVVDEISDITDSHIGFLHFIEEDQKNINLQIWSTETIQAVGRIDAQGTHHHLDAAGIWADALRQRQSIIHNDYENLPNKKGLPEDHLKVTRELVIPIVRDERVTALLAIGNKPEAYTQHDVDITERFADYAWDIIERRQMEAALADERNQLAKRVEERTADLSRANSNLARALRVKDEFLANMSHELRTPLNAILGLSESLSEQVAGPLNEKQQKYLSTINESGHHLLSLINDILDLAKIEAGQITLDINKVDVNSVCQASLRMIKQLAQKKNQEVLFEIDSDVGLMWADERRLKQMIVNLLSNAVKFTPESSQLGLKVNGDQAANRVVITVWDRGIGINNQDMDRLFKPFVQLDSGLAREATGTGLGLALVAQMARLHGGSVTVESQVGEGSRFTILLPWEPALAVDASIRLRNTGKFSAIDPNATNKPTLLLIEDTREVVMMLVDYLEMSGFKMVTAQDGTDGIQQAKLFHPNLILMDVMMPGMDGFETTRRLRKDPQFKDTPIIALTALAMPSDRQRCLDAGMDEYISKPVNLKALVKLIRSILLEKEDTKSK